MDKKLFEEIMDKWLSHEIESIPELSPKEELYRTVESKKKRSRKWFQSPFGWTAVATAAAAVLLFVIFFPNISKQRVVPQEPASVLFEGEAADELKASRARMEPTEREIMEEVKSGGAFNQLYFQQQNLALL